VAAGAEREVRRQLVGPTVGPAHAALGQLVAECVCERLDRVIPTNRVAVDVEEGVELVEAASAVAAQQREAGRTQLATEEAASGIVIDGRQGRLVVVGWAASVAPVDTRPQEVAKLAQLVEDRDAIGGQCLERRVDPSELGEQRLASGVETAADGCRDAGGAANGVVAGADVLLR
jgi:hypothetical protein